MAETLSIPARFNGPLESGNGGYCSGVVAGFVDGLAEVSLRAPVPLDRALDVVREPDGSVRVLDGDAAIAEARPVAELDIEVPPPVSLDDARVAAAAYRGARDSVFGRCFVCGAGARGRVRRLRGRRGRPAGRRVAMDAAGVDRRRRRQRAA